jgi:hypothetical protein
MNMEDSARRPIRLPDQVRVEEGSEVVVMGGFQPPANTLPDAGSGVVKAGRLPNIQICLSRVPASGDVIYLNDAHRPDL